MKKYRKLSEFERQSKAINSIKDENQYVNVREGIRAAYANQKLSHAAYQALLKKLSDKAEEMRIFYESVR